MVVEAAGCHVEESLRLDTNQSQYYYMFPLIRNGRAHLGTTTMRLSNWIAKCMGGWHRTSADVIGLVIATNFVGENVRIVIVGQVVGEAGC